MNRVKSSKKTFNNVVSAIRAAWAYGYKNLPGKQNPALGLECVRRMKKDKPKPDVRNGTISVSKARVDGHDKDYTKTDVDRVVELCPRALDCLKRQLALRARLKLAGKVKHEKVFLHADGSAFHELQVQWKRWVKTESVLKLRRRDPYSARHTSVSWNLMIGKNPLWVALQQEGHSVASCWTCTQRGRRAGKTPTSQPSVQQWSQRQRASCAKPRSDGTGEALPAKLLDDGLAPSRLTSITCARSAMRAIAALHARGAWGRGAVKGCTARRLAA